MTNTDHHHATVDEEALPKPHKEGGYARYGGIYKGWGGEDDWSGRRHHISRIIFTILLILGITALVVWLLYRPHTPRFRVSDATINQLNATASPAPLLSATMQFTVVTRNPNQRVKITYENLSAFVSYRNQAITPPLTLPPLTHETKSTVTFSPVLGGFTGVPVAEEVVNGLMNDQQAYGVVGLSLVVDGRMRYRGGPVSRRHRAINVRCDLYVGFRGNGQFPVLGSPPCAVRVN